MSVGCRQLDMRDSSITGFSPLGLLEYILVMTHGRGKLGSIEIVNLPLFRHKALSNLDKATLGCFCLSKGIFGGMKVIIVVMIQGWSCLKHKVGLYDLSTPLPI